MAGGWGGLVEEAKLTQDLARHFKDVFFSFILGQLMTVPLFLYYPLGQHVYDHNSGTMSRVSTRRHKS